MVYVPVRLQKSWMDLANRPIYSAAGEDKELRSAHGKVIDHLFPCLTAFIPV